LDGSLDAERKFGVRELRMRKLKGELRFLNTFWSAEIPLCLLVLTLSLEQVDVV
jgi:hypothetical protein